MSELRSEERTTVSQERGLQGVGKGASEGTAQQRHRYWMTGTQMQRGEAGQVGLARPWGILLQGIGLYPEINQVSGLCYRRNY